MLVNTAGIGYFGTVEESEDAEVRRMFEINVFALGRMTSATLPVMRRQRSGTIINIASLAGIRPSAGLGCSMCTPAPGAACTPVIGGPKPAPACVEEAGAWPAAWG